MSPDDSPPPRTSETLAFFKREEEWLRRGTRFQFMPWPTTLIAPVVLTAVVLVLLITLQSNVLVWAYIGLLAAVAGFGFWQIRLTEHATANALRHATELEQRRQAGGSRAKLVAHLENRISA